MTFSCNIGSIDDVLHKVTSTVYYCAMASKKYICRKKPSYLELTTFITRIFGQSSSIRFTRKFLCIVQKIVKEETTSGRPKRMAVTIHEKFLK